jgi:hypothetical protein
MSAGVHAPGTAPARKAPAEEPFIITAMLSLLGGALWIALRPELLLQFYYSPEMLALTHLLTLGFATSLIMGVLLRLAPMALRCAPRSRAAALAQCVLYLLGVPGMVIHFALGSWVGLAWSTLFVLAATLVQAANFGAVFRRALAGDPVALHVAAALVNLVLAATLGSSFGMLRAHGIGAGWLTAPLLDRIAAHLHLALVGWITLMILGLQLQLLPSSGGGRRWLTLRFAALELGLLASVTCLLTGWPGRAAGAALVLAALAAHVRAALAGFSTRRADVWELVALLMLLLLGGTGLALALDVPDPSSPLRLRVEFAYGVVALFGWVTLTVASTAFKLFPQWVWEERFLPERQATGAAVPAPAALFSQRLRHASGALLALGSLATAAGMLADSEVLVAVSAWVLVAGVLAFVANFARTARWALLRGEWRPPPDAAR